MPRKKVAESERCSGVLPSGAPCLHRARYGEPPRWCAVCDPSPEAAARRRAVGGQRHPPGSPEAKKRDEARSEGTLDDIVRRALHFAWRLEKVSAKDPAVTARVAFAASRLYAQAIAGLKARGTTGDLPGRRSPPGNSHEQDTPPPGKGSGDPLDELESELAKLDS